MLERAKQLVLKAAQRTAQQQARYKKYYDKRIRTSVDLKDGDEVFIDNPPSVGKPMSERLAGEHHSNLSKKTSKAHKVVTFDDFSVTIDRDGTQDKVSIDRVTKFSPPLDMETLKPARISDGIMTNEQEGAPPTTTPRPGLTAIFGYTRTRSRDRPPHRFSRRPRWW